VQGAINPPSIRIENLKIARRHVHAEALAEFYRHYPDLFKDSLEAMFDPDANQSDELLMFLGKHLPQLAERLKRIVPNKLHAQLGLADWSWLDGGNLGEDEKRESFSMRLEHASSFRLAGLWRPHMLSLIPKRKHAAAAKSFNPNDTSIQNSVLRRRLEKEPRLEKQGLR